MLCSRRQKYGSLLHRACELTALGVIRVLLEHGTADMNENEGQGVLLAERLVFGHTQCGVGFVSLHKDFAR